MTLPAYVYPARADERSAPLLLEMAQSSSTRREASGIDAASTGVRAPARRWAARLGCYRPAGTPSQTAPGKNLPPM